MVRYPKKLIILIIAGAFILPSCSMQTPATANPFVSPLATSNLETPTITQSLIQTMQTAIETPQQPTATSFPPTLAITPTTTLTPTPSEVGWILDMNFMDAQHGWLLASTNQNGKLGIAIRQTFDGATSWTALPAPQAVPGYLHDFTASDLEQVHQIRFVDEKTGWVFRPGLFYTQDGGVDWQQVNPGGEVVALEPAKSSDPVWSIVQNCTGSWDCTAKLYQATSDQPGQWKHISNLPIQHPLLAFTRPDAMTGYVLSNVGPDNFKVSLVATHDRGKSWTTQTTPCISEQPLLSSPDVSHLFMVCSGLPGAGQQFKQFYASLDGGETWNLIQKSDNENGTSNFGYADALLFTSPESGFLGLGRYFLFTTHDGGVSWTMSDLPNDNDASGWVLAEDGSQDIYAALQTTLYHSLDGGLSWRSTEIH